MKTVTLGSTKITAIQNGFGALPVQRVSVEEGVRLLRLAYEGGMRFFDTARAYSNSELKVGEALKIYDRNSLFIATKTHAGNVEEFWKDLKTSLELLQTDYVDIYQFHQADQCYKPNDGTGMYEAMLEAKAQGKIRHIGITSHSFKVALEAIESGLYETLQFPFSYLATDIELNLVEQCRKQNMGFIAMKGLAGGLLTDSEKCMAFMSQFDNVMPIWGIQRESELKEWLSYNENTPAYDEGMKSFIEKEKKELSGDFCRGCGYCMPCPMDIKINNCARMSLMLRRAPSANWLSESWQKEMFKIDQCLECYSCASQCPYKLDTPQLLKKNLEDYKAVLSGKKKI